MPRRAADSGGPNDIIAWRLVLALSLMGVEPMQTLIGITSLERRSKARLALAIAFLFFGLYSAPHRVHHFFEPLAPAQNGITGHHDNRAPEDAHGHERVPQAPGTDTTDCTVQSLAQNAHASTPPLIELPLPAFAYARFHYPTIAWAAAFNPSPFSQRAPPFI
jgi:hypothetical protein